MSKSNEINWLTERFLRDFCEPSVVQADGTLFYQSCKPNNDKDLYLFLDSDGKSLCEEIHEDLFFRIGIAPFTLILQAWHMGEETPEAEKRLPLDCTFKSVTGELTALLIDASKPYFAINNKRK